MTSNVWGKIAQFASRLYPVRQVYFRANGAVRFFVLTPRTQMAATVVAFAAAGWIGIATINLFFEDEIMAAKEHQLAEGARAYEALNGEMESLRRGVLATAEELAARQRFLSDLVIARDTAPADIADETEIPLQTKPKSTSLSLPPVAEAPVDTEQEDAPGKSSGLARRIGNVAAFVFPFTETRRPTSGEHEQAVAEISRRLEQINADQQALSARLLARTLANLDKIEEIVEVAGLTGDKLLDALDTPLGGQGGPFVLDTAAPDMKIDSKEATDDFYRLLQQLQRLAGLKTVLGSLPLAEPAKHYYISSAFGRRRDPFNKRRAMHAAVDLSGPWKEPILATAPGVITRSGFNGPYGRFVEIDHGHGFKTRYGHMAKILVAKGDEVELGDKIGLMGNSGRATSTHLHYEIWFGGTPRNAVKFFKAAKYVQK